MLELSWHCRSGIFIEVRESTSELGPGNWGEQDGGDHAAKKLLHGAGIPWQGDKEWVCPTVNLCKSSFDSNTFLLTS